MYAWWYFWTTFKFIMTVRSHCLANEIKSSCRITSLLLWLMPPVVADTSSCDSLMKNGDVDCVWGRDDIIMRMISGTLDVRALKPGGDLVCAHSQISVFVRSKERKEFSTGICHHWNQGFLVQKLSMLFSRLTFQTCHFKSFAYRHFL